MVPPALAPAQPPELAVSDAAPHAACNGALPHADAALAPDGPRTTAQPLADLFLLPELPAEHLAAKPEPLYADQAGPSTSAAPAAQLAANPAAAAVVEGVKEELSLGAPEADGIKEEVFDADAAVAADDGVRRRTTREIKRRVIMVRCLDCP